MPAPSVTVLLPVYNGSSHLRESIPAVLDQTLEDFELLVVDDASTDDSAETVAGFADSRIRILVNERNLGQVETVNRGLREARGEYVARLDQDDICLPRRLERQAAILDSEPSVGLVGCWVDLVDPEGRVVERIRETIDDYPSFLYLLLAHRLPIAHSAAMFRRADVLELGGYNVRYRLAEDSDLWRRLALVRRAARVVPEVLLRYLVHEGQQSSGSHEEQMQNSRDSLDVFIHALAPSAPAADLRRLFMLEPAPASAIAAFPAFIHAASTRVSLAAEESEELEGLLRRHVYRGALRGWRDGVVDFWRRAPALVRFGAAGSPGRWPAFAMVAVVAPLLALARAARRRARSLGR